MTFACPACRFSTAIEVWPFFCACGIRYDSAADMIVAASGRQRKSKHKVSSGGQGRELLAVVKELGIAHPGCGCKSVAGRMNAWGVDGCWSNREQLLRDANFVEVLASLLGLKQYPPWLSVPRSDGWDREIEHARYAAAAEQLLCYLAWRAERCGIQWPAPVPIPCPPPLALQPKHDRAIVTVASGDGWRAMLRITGPFMRAYAELVGADFVVCDWPGNEAWPLSSKYGALSALRHYSRISFVDADVLLRPGCINLFEACRPDEFGAVDELVFHRLSKVYHIERDYRELREQLGYPHRPVNFYLNTGVFVCPRECSSLLEPPAALPPYHCAEQDLLTARVAQQLEDGKIKFRLIDRRCNWQWWTNEKFVNAPADAILHISGFKDQDKRIKAMAALAVKYEHHLPPAILDIPPSHEWPGEPTWHMDRRHVQWLHAVLMSGQFARCLEIGSYQGYSTTAFLEAAKAGMIERLEICDPWVQPHLETTVASYGLGSRFHWHRCPSLEVLRDQPDYDLVCVDGDHSVETTAAELELILARGVPNVFAHDTSGDFNLPGPQQIKVGLERAGYLCLEDNVDRPGEGTARGLFFATRDRRAFEMAKRFLAVFAA